MDYVDTSCPLYRELIPIFATAINFGPFFDDTGLKKASFIAFYWLTFSVSTEATDKQGIVLSTASPSTEEAIQAWDLLLDHIFLR